MQTRARGRARPVLIWLALVLVIAVPAGLAAASPLLAWRDPVYILAGFAGVGALVFLLLQPLLAGGYLPGLPALTGRRVHRITGQALVLMILLHVGGLWITSPPDVVDALLFTSPTPFSAWGVIAMWSVFLAACLAAMRGRLGIKPIVWRKLHTGLAVVTVMGSVIHAVLITGTMETVSKAMLCLCVLVATGKVIHDLRVWKRRVPRR